MSRLFLGILVLFVTPSLLSAHPGRTASDGCHYCRTNCEKWGVPKGERHCHSNRIEDIQVKNIKYEKRKTTVKRERDKEPGWEYKRDITKISAPFKRLWK